jgi:DNA-cytosine methyltransferase
MRFVSLFAGVGGFDLGLERSGHTCVGQVEIDKHARLVLDKHWPNVPKHDDVRTAKEWADAIGLVGTTDLVCGGFPCQDVSVAGKRAGIAGARSGLFFDALEFAVHIKAKYLILENVPGLLSSNNGRDFGVVISEMANAGYRHIEWRLLDSQFFGVPQRRRRVFIVGCTADRSGSPIFIEREGLRRDTEASKQKGKTTPFATPISTGDAGREIVNTIPAELYHKSTVVNQDVANGHLVVTSSSFGGYSEGIGTLRANGGDLGGGSENLVVQQKSQSTD